MIKYHWISIFYNIQVLNINLNLGYYLYKSNFNEASCYNVSREAAIAFAPSIFISLLYFIN